MYLILIYSLKDIFKVIKSIIKYWAISYLINNDVLCTSALKLICRSFDQNWKKRNTPFLNKNSTKLARTHKSDASLSMLIA